MKYCAIYWWMGWIENVTLTKGSVNRKKRCVGQTNEVLHCCCFLLRLLCLICMCCRMMRDSLFGEICILNIKYFLTNEEVDVPSVMNETNTPIQTNGDLLCDHICRFVFLYRIHMLILSIFLTIPLIREQKLFRWSLSLYIIK